MLAGLRVTGVAVRARCSNGVMHEFFTMSAVVDEAKQAVTEAAAGLRPAFKMNE